jgi:DNA-binding CsgD family transcriptional regulator
MINIIIDGEYKLYNHGLKMFLGHILMEQFKISSRHFDCLNDQTIQDADIIVTSLEAGERYICHPLLKKRKKNSLVIGLYNRESHGSSKRLPHCTKKMVYINRAESLSEIKKTVLLQWEMRNDNSFDAELKNCQSCHYRTLSPQQINVAERYLSGQSIQEIAVELNLNRKTVLSHKYMVMRKFNLISDYELVSFLTKVDLPENVPGLFHGCTKRKAFSSGGL